MPEVITIIGGGLAGLTLGIGLRQRGIPVVVWEAGQYPRHRVCGEFINGHGLATLERLGLRAGLQTAGARPAVTLALFSAKAGSPVRTLPEPSVGLSRYVLDACLAREFQTLGGELRPGMRWRGDCPEGTVRTNGRRLERSTGGWRMFGLKVHARGVALNADLEMHFVPSGYVGLCRLAGGEVNICGLFRSSSTVPDLARSWRTWLGGPDDSVLHSRLAAADLDESSFCSVAGLCLSPLRAADPAECAVGDALAMIPPFTGNGMSMAFESAELAIEPLARFSCGELTWPEGRTAIANACENRFTARLRYATWLHHLLFNRPARSALLFAAARSDWLWRALFSSTR